MLRILSAILSTLALWLARRRTRLQLFDLDAHLLRDIGIDDAKRDEECAQWMWQGRTFKGVTSKENGRRLRAPVSKAVIVDRF